MDKAAILRLLETDKRAVVRALLVLNERQTRDEQVSQNTRYLNGRGFRPCHARRGTSMALFFKQRGYLTDPQIEYWRQRDRAGNMRIGIYWGQLLEEAELKKAKAKEFNGFPSELAYLEYTLGEVMDSDDPSIIDPIVARIKEIKAQQ